MPANPVSKPLCITFAGVPGCGKTPVAHYLSWKLGLPILSNDAMRTETQEDTLSTDVNSEAYMKLRDARLGEVLSRKASFIYDASVDRTWGKYKPRLSEEGYRWLIISFDLSPEFLARMAEAKGYRGNEHLLSSWHDQHEAFLASYKSNVDVAITDENFHQRMSLASTRAQEVTGD